MAEYKRHQGHRQRMRERVQNYGLDSLADHEVLEYILYTTNAQRDTNEIAYNLLERFGDFASVLEASEEELCTVAHLGKAVAHAAAGQPVLRAQPHRRKALLQDYGTAGQLSDGKICLV